jgi:hypothetical protein
MKKIIIAIERSKFNYLYKYNICTVSTVNIIDYSLPQLLELYKFNLNAAASIIEKALPIFESEHEVILLEVESSEISYNLEFGFNAVKRLIPLNELAKELLQSKLNSDFQYTSPIPEGLYEAVFALREDKLRLNSGLAVLSCFDLPAPTTSFINLVKNATRRLIFNEDISKDAGTIDFLLEFNTTPSGIPSGNIEGVMKIICVGMLKVTGNADRLRESPLFNLLLDNMDILNQGSLLICYQNFQKLSNENWDKVEKLEATLASAEIDADILLLLFLCISFKKELQINDFDLKSISFDINEIKSIYSKELSQALYLVGYTMSMGALHESIHRLSFSPLFEKEFETVKEKLIIDKELSVDEITPESNSQFNIKYDSVNVENEKPDYLDISHNSSDMNVGVPEIFSDSSLETIEDSEREKLLKELKNKMKGSQRKKALDLVDSLYREDLNFSYELLEEKIMSNKEFLKKDGRPVKPVQSLLDIFIPIKRK